MIIKIPVGWFVWQGDIKLYMERKGLTVAKMIEKSTVTYYKAIVIKTMQYLHKDEQKSNWIEQEVQKPLWIFRYLFCNTKELCICMHKEICSYMFHVEQVVYDS